MGLLNQCKIGSVTIGDLCGRFVDAPRLEISWGHAMAPSTLALSWACALQAQRPLPVTWGATLAASRALAMQWASTEPAAKALMMEWGAAAASVSSLPTSWGYDMPAQAALPIYYALLGAVDYTVPAATMTDGVTTWSLLDVEITQASTSPAWMASVTTAMAPPDIGEDVILHIGTTSWMLRVVDVSASRMSPVDGGWIVRAQSASAVELAAIPAESRLLHNGRASDVCAALCAPWPLAWDVEDYDLAPPAIDSLVGLSCLDAAARIASISGRLLCLPSGVLMVQPREMPARQAPTCLEATLDGVGISSAVQGVRVSSWGISDSLTAEGDGYARTVYVSLSPRRAVDLVVEIGQAGTPVWEDQEIIETVGLIDGVAQVSAPISSIRQARAGDESPVQVGYWPGQTAVWTSTPTHLPVTIIYTTARIALPVTLPPGAHAAHVLVEDIDA